MANIHEQIKAGEAIVKHTQRDKDGRVIEQGEKMLKLPELARDLAPVLQDVKGFLEVLELHDATLAFLHGGLKEYMVGWRAHCRPSELESLSTITDEHSVLFKQEVQDVPKAKKTKMTKKEMIQALKASGMSKEDIIALCNG